MTPLGSCATSPAAVACPPKLGTVFGLLETHQQCRGRNFGSVEIFGQRRLSSTSSPPRTHSSARPRRRPPGPPSIATSTATSFAHTAPPTSIGSACAFTAPVFPLLAPPRPPSPWSPARRTPSPSWPKTQSSSVSQMPTRPSRRGERSWVSPTPGRSRASPKVCSKGRAGQSPREKGAPA